MALKLLQSLGWPCQARQLRAEPGLSPGRSWHRAAGGLEAGEGRVPGAAGDGGEGLGVRGARVGSFKMF